MAIIAVHQQRSCVKNEVAVNYVITVVDVVKAPHGVREVGFALNGEVSAENGSNKPTVIPN